MLYPYEKSSLPSNHHHHRSPAVHGHRSKNNRRRISIAVVTIIFTLCFYFRSSSRAGFFTATLFAGFGGGDDDDFHQALTMSRQTFVVKAFTSTLNTYNSTPIEAYCAGKSWNKEKAMDCGRIEGDIGTMKQTILNCLRSSIDAEAGFIVPRISTSGGETGDDAGTKLEAVFDHEIFTSRIISACPGMPIYDEDVEMPHDKHIQVVKFSPKSQSSTTVCDGPPGFATNFGSLLLFSPLLYDLSFGALHTLAKKFQLLIAPDFNTDNTAAHSSYLALSLGDSVSDVQERYYDKLRYYLSLVSWGLFSPVIYVASENEAAVRQFAKYASTVSLPMSVVTQRDLLDRSSTRAVLGGADLSKEQQAVVDYVIFENAAYFAGLNESFLTWNVAFSRAELRGGEQAVCSSSNSTDSWRDGWSEIMGSGTGDLEKYERTIWP